MIKVVAKNFIKEDRTEEFISMAKTLVQDTRTNDSGCIRYELVQDVKDPRIITMLEEWKDQESLNLHMAAEHFKKAMAAFGDFSEKPGEINLYKTLA
ncbi:putative quinol monooxygenase [Lachnospiraceae bacterium 54-53]